MRFIPPCIVYLYNSQAFQTNPNRVYIYSPIQLHLSSKTIFSFMDLLEVIGVEKGAALRIIAAAASLPKQMETHGGETKSSTQQSSAQQSGARQSSAQQSGAQQSGAQQSSTQQSGTQQSSAQCQFSHTMPFKLLKNNICDLCNGKIKNSNGFRCDRCNYNICITCGSSNTRYYLPYREPDFFQKLQPSLKQRILNFHVYNDYKLVGRTCKYLHVLWKEAVEKNSCWMRILEKEQKLLWSYCALKVSFDAFMF